MAAPDKDTAQVSQDPTLLEDPTADPVEPVTLAKAKAVKHTVDSALKAGEIGQAEALARTGSVADRISGLTKVQAAYRERGDTERVDDLQLHIDRLGELKHPSKES